MKERPILFSGPMVRAILEGKKTQTRRIAKVPDYVRGSEAPQKRRGEPPKHERPYFDAYNGGPLWCWWDEYDRCGDGIKCPYGVPGDRLWVRETFQPFFQDGFIYLADAGTGRLNAATTEQAKANWPGWKPSIHMPRKASRITLEVTEVRVQRLQEITADDARAEGVKIHVSAKGALLLNISERVKPDCKMYRDTKNATVDDYFVGEYALLWNEINLKRAPWDSNPWVWAVSFRRLQK